MKLYLNGTENKYAVEQSLLTMFPSERPEYPEGRPEGERCEITVRRGGTCITCSAVLYINGGCFHGNARAELSLLPLACYRGQLGLQNKWFFYIFYPAHLLGLWALGLALN